MWRNECRVFTNDGSLLASAGSPRESKLVAAIAANIWEAYENNGPRQDALGMLITQCLEGYVLTARINPDLLLCLYCKNDVDVGVLKAKGDVMVDYLVDPLSTIVVGAESAQ